MYVARFLAASRQGEIRRRALRALRRQPQPPLHSTMMQPRRYRHAHSDNTYAAAARTPQRRTPRATIPRRRAARGSAVLPPRCAVFARRAAGELAADTPRRMAKWCQPFSSPRQRAADLASRRRMFCAIASMRVAPGARPQRPAATPAAGSLYVCASGTQPHSRSLASRRRTRQPRRRLQQSSAPASRTGEAGEYAPHYGTAVLHAHFSSPVTENLSKVMK